jgi:hypothetical protein
MSSRHVEEGAGREYADPRDHSCSWCAKTVYSGRLTQRQMMSGPMWLCQTCDEREFPPRGSNRAAIRMLAFAIERHGRYLSQYRVARWEYVAARRTLTPQPELDRLLVTAIGFRARWTCLDEAIVAAERRLEVAA